MGGTASALVRRLDQPDAIRHQVLAFLFIARIHNSVKLSYEKFLSTRRVSISKSCLRIRRRRRQSFAVEGLERGITDKQTQASATSNDGLDESLKRRKRRQQAPRAESNVNANLTSRKAISKQESKQDPRLTWHGFPQLWSPFARYDTVSKCWMVYASVRALFLQQLGHLLDPLSKWLFGIPGHCLLMGRIVIPFALSQLLSVLFASYHLVWRFTQEHSANNRLLTMIVFLLASERDLENFYARMETEELNDYLPRNSFMPMPSGSTSMWTHNEPAEMASCRSEKLQPLRSARPLGQTELLLRQVMCYKVEESFIGGTKKRVYYKLRPNRTREARRRLTRHMAIVSLVTLTCFALEFIVVFSLTWLAVLSDYRYALLYPGCYPLLDERLARGELSPWPLSVTFKNHHLISGAFFDFVENFILWGDSGLSLTFVPTLAYLLNYDLLFYWSHLNHRLELLLARSIRECSLAQQQQLQQLRPANNAADSRTGATTYNFNCTLPSLPIFNQDLLRASTSTGTTTTIDTSTTSWHPSRYQSIMRLEHEINELQFEIYDFFHEVQRADTLVGDTLTAAIIIWLFFCAFVNYNLLLKNVSSQIVLLILVLGFFVISVISYYLFELRRCCSKTYRMLCSLMAHDQTRKKGTFIALLDFYLDRDATTYHLCRSYAYKPETFIALIGWTVSCFFIAYTLLMPHQTNI